ncbi:Uncharacterised protein [Serratia quinivorans]|uniref:hypothetical protein n=1 Tax=Serratia quinivorans TaxID=137545 RepID=UPI0021789FB6|nr:hypothetical protein [Serratia quinivorans]CAI1574939.1 Uncharacterised protein [Serratia quinivorans]CAI1767962.1 Uncharacterised protein [Serratia quinivorans]
MDGVNISLDRIFFVSRSYFPDGHFRVEVWDIGLRFVWRNQDDEWSAFLQKDLSKIDESCIRGFLEAELDGQENPF